MKKWILLFSTLLLIAVPSAYAGPKEDFVAAVKKHCGKSDADAEKMATPGRSGTVMQWKTCSAASIEIEGCKLPCKDASSSIGG